MTKINDKNAEVVLTNKDQRRVTLTPAQCIAFRKNLKKIMSRGSSVTITTNDLVIEFVVENK
ncbi:MAG: hypothetical protein KDD62_00290 [Bdellovibrionales bacterium]|nr:hypothetical protein [Bdellovibrionales bacterium]